MKCNALTIYTNLCFFCYYVIIVADVVVVSGGGGVGVFVADVMIWRYNLMRQNKKLLLRMFSSPLKTLSLLQIIIFTLLKKFKKYFPHFFAVEK
jgi:hypothetical protein